MSISAADTLTGLALPASMFTLVLVAPRWRRLSALAGSGALPTVLAMAPAIVQLSNFQGAADGVAGVVVFGFLNELTLPSKEKRS